MGKGLEEALARKRWLFLELDFLGELNRKVFVWGDSIMIIVCNSQLFIGLFQKSSWTLPIIMKMKTHMKKLRIRDGVY